MTMGKPEMTMDEFLSRVEALGEGHDGHVTIFKFTTGWKIVPDTADDLRILLAPIPGRMTLAEAMDFAEIKKPSQCGGPAWIPCTGCGEHQCTIHSMHVCDCACPPIEEWEVNPYRFGGPDPARMER